MPTPSYRLVWTLLVFAWIANYVVRMAMPALLPAAIGELGLSYAQAGLLGLSVFFYTYAATQFPAGVLGDRFGRRRLVVWGLLVSALGAVATGFAGAFAALLAARLLTGAGQGCLFSNDRAIIAAVTPRERLALGQAISFTGPGLGITAGLLLAGYLAEVMPWRRVFLVLAALPLAAAILVTRFVPEPPRTPQAADLLTRLRAVLVQRDLWLLGLSALTGMWGQFVLATWAPMLFVEIGFRETGRAALYASLQGLAGVGGLLAGGWIGDRAGRRPGGHRTVLACGLGLLALTTSAMAAVLASSRSPALLAAAVVAVGFSSWAIWGPSYALLASVFRGDDLSTAYGFYNTLGVLGAIFGPWVTGFTRDLTGSFAAGWVVSSAVAAAGALTVLAIRPPAAAEVTRSA